jgi:maltose-binding protein MalE
MRDFLKIKFSKLKKANTNINISKTNIINKGNKTLVGFISILSLLGIFLFGSFSFFSCANNNGAVAEPQAPIVSESTILEETGNTVTEEVEIRKRSISVWDSCEPKGRIFLMDNIENFLKENENIDISMKHFRSEEELVDVFTAASLAGAGPEIVLLSFDSMKKLAAENVLREIGDEFDYSKFLAGLNDLTSFEDKKYIVPFSSSDFLILYFNKSAIQEIPTTFDNIIEYSKEKINSKDKHKTGYGFLLNASEPDWVIPFVGGYLDWIYNYDTGMINLNTNSMKNTLNFLDTLYNKEKIMPFEIGYENINEAFKSGEVDMIINGTWAINEYKEAGINFGVAKIPKVSDAITNPTPMISGLGFVVNVTCSNENFEVVKNFINYMISTDVQESLIYNTYSFPSILGLEKSELLNDDNIYNSLLQAKVCRGKPAEEDLRIIRDVIRTNLESFISGSLTVDDAVNKMQEEAIKLKSGEVKIEGDTSTTESGG